MKIGFTGTREGMTNKQRKALDILLFEMPDSLEVHHGDCGGADMQFHELAIIHGARVIIHPPSNPVQRAFCQDYEERREPKPYIQRNHDIVDETDRLIVAPLTFKEEIHSGTWATYRYAFGQGKPITIVWPDGRIEVMR